MTKDEVIALAREAAFHTPVMEGELIRFANLIHDHLTWSDIHTCHPGCTKPPCVAMREAVLAEREECAKLAEGATAAWTEHVYNDACMHIAAAIRSRT